VVGGVFVNPAPGVIVNPTPGAVVNPPPVVVNPPATVTPAPGAINPNAPLNPAPNNGVVTGSEPVVGGVEGTRTDTVGTVGSGDVRAGTMRGTTGDVRQGDVRQMGPKGLRLRDSGRVRYEGRYRVDYEESTGTYHRRYVQDYGVRPDDYGFSLSWSWSHGAAH
jgi:hypothetical protein